MANYINKIKLACLKGMEAIGKSASNLASNAHTKVTEINLETRRRELMGEFPLKAHDLWQNGVALPEPLGDMLAELNELDEKLSLLRAQRYATVEAEEADATEAVAAEADEQYDEAAIQYEYAEAAAEYEIPEQADEETNECAISGTEQVFDESVIAEEAVISDDSITGEE